MNMLGLLGIRPKLIVPLILFGLIHLIYTQSNETAVTGDPVDQMLDKWRNMISISSPNYDELTKMLHDMENNFPFVVELYTIGISVEARTLWAIKLTMDVKKERELMKPLVKHVANMHGNEVLGRSLVLLFALDLLRNYKDATRDAKNNTIISTPARDRAMRILEKIEVHIVPSVNPDGFEMATSENCGEPDDEWFKVGGRGRRNARNIDLNRNFPDPFFTTQDDYEEVFSADRQPETVAVMEWILRHPFVLSLNFHSGALVASYPYDAVPGAIKNISSYENQGVHSITPDDRVAIELAYLYSSSHKTMISENDPSPSACGEKKYFFDKGIINGAFWYDIRGSMQDFNYMWSNCIEITIEAACCKFPDDSVLPEEWENNKESIYLFTEAVLLWGFKGIVKDMKGNPVHAAKMYVMGNSKPVLTTSRGEFWKILPKYDSNVEYYTAYAEFYGCESERKQIHLRNSTEMPIVDFTISDCHNGGSKMEQNNFLLVFILLLPLFLIHFKRDFRNK